MWPDYEQTDAMSEAGEWLLEEVYNDALAVWAPALIPMVLPLLDGNEDLPPDIDAVNSEQARVLWVREVISWIAPTVQAIWSWIYVQGTEAFSSETPPEPPVTAAGVKRPDPVADLVALAFETSPQQINMALRLVWNDTKSKARLTRFLNAEQPVLNGLPGRIRDLLIGGTTTSARAKLPVHELRDQLGMWLGQATDMRRSRNTRQRLARRGDVIGTMKHPGHAKYVDVWVPRTAPAMSFFQPFRDIARQAGYQTAGILNDAVLTAASQSGVYFDKVWIARMDARTRPPHYVADGQRAELDADFTVGGISLSYPGDPEGPPELIRNCRCRVGMVLVGEDLPAEVRRSRAQRREIAFRSATGQVRAREDPQGIGYIIPMAASGEPKEKDMSAPVVIESEAPPEAETYRTFTDAVIAFIGVPTSDFRVLAKGIQFDVRTPPLPLMWCRQREEGHDHASTVGIIESARVEDDKVLASGYMLNTPEADEAAEMLKHGVTRPSVDLGRHRWYLANEAGEELSDEEWFELGPRDRVFTTFTEAELMGMTLVATPAFGDTKVTLNEQREPRNPGLVASAAAQVAPRTYPASHFADPQLAEATLPTMTDDGRVYGHIACWGQCHRSVQTACVMAPRSPSNYSHFHTSPAVRLDDDTRLPVGRLTVGTGHAPDTLSGVPAQAHYDNTGSCWALVRVGEDSHGIWFSGVVAPWASTEQIEAGLASPLSGDWRDFGQGLELVAALSVNTPGFAARGGTDDAGRPVALVAALGPGPDVERQELTRDDIKAAVAEALADQRFAAQRDAALRAAAEIAPVKTPTEQVTELLAKAVI